MHLYQNQSLWSLIMPTKRSDLASATVTQIHYKSPDGFTGTWNATVSGENLVYNIQNGDINQKGIWYFQTYVEIGGRKAYGKINQHTFPKPLVIT